MATDPPNFFEGKVELSRDELIVAILDKIIENKKQY